MSIFNYFLNRLTTVHGDLNPRVSVALEPNQQGSDEVLSSGKYSYFQDESVQDKVVEVLQNVTIIDVDTVEDSKIMDSPVESGILISDHRIFNPIEITVNCVLPATDWKDTYNEIRYWFEKNDTGFLTIVTKAGVYRNMQLIGLPHKENSDTVSRLFFELHFRSILFRRFLYVRMPLPKVEKPDYASYEDAGKKLAIERKYSPVINNSSRNTVSNVSFTLAQ